MTEAAIQLSEPESPRRDNSARTDGGADIEITLPESVKKFASASTQLMIQAPQMVCLLIIVGGFLWQLDRIGERQLIMEDNARQLDDLRINTCHEVQDRSVDALRELSTQMAVQSESFDELVDEMRDLGDIIEDRM